MGDFKEQSIYLTFYFKLMKNNIQNNYKKYAGNAGVKSRISCYDQEIKQQSSQYIKPPSSHLQKRGKPGQTMTAR
jgi:hypothetical protein